MTIAIGAILTACAVVFVLRPLFSGAYDRAPRDARAPGVPERAGPLTGEDLEAAVRSFRATHADCANCGLRPEPDAAYCSNCGRMLQEPL
jgi:hypothetical protein